MTRGPARAIHLATLFGLACLSSGPVDAGSLCAYRTDSGAIVYTNQPTNDGLCAQPSKAPPIGAPSRSAVQRYDPIIRSWAQQYGVSQKLVHAVVATESAYNPGAVSSKGARGLMQLMPATARRYGVRDSFDATENIRGGVAHLRDLLDAFGGDTRLAVAAYNAGQGAVERYEGIPPYAETRDYVRKVMTRMGGHTRGITASSSASAAGQSVRLLVDDSGRISMVN